MTIEQEQIIIKNVLAGDTRPYAILVNTYKDMAVLLSYNILLNQEDAEEVAQDAFVKAYTALPSYKGDARFSTWLFRIVINASLNKKRVNKHQWMEITAAAGELPFDIHSIPTGQITGEHRKHIQAALQSLNLNERLCISLFYLNELSIEEIRGVTGLSASNIKVLLHRGRKNLYTALCQHLKSEITNII